jgi:hypothetical protein
MSGKAPREQPPVDPRVLEADVLGALAIVLHGREAEAPPRPAPRPPAAWRGRGRGASDRR